MDSTEGLPLLTVCAEYRALGHCDCGDSSARLWRPGAVLDASGKLLWQVHPKARLDDLCTNCFMDWASDQGVFGNIQWGILGLSHSPPEDPDEGDDDGTPNAG